LFRVSCSAAVASAAGLLLLLLLLLLQFDAEMSYRRCAQVVTWHRPSAIGSLFKVSRDLSGCC
jgi:hypothetical protein